MAKYTLLQMVQSILSSMDSDEVNSISDTTESLQVADIIRVTYDDLIATVELPSQFQLFNLQPSLNPSEAIVMYRPDNVVNLDWIKYDCQKYGDGYVQMTDMKYLDQDTFLRRMYMLSSLDTGVFTFPLTVNGQTFQIQGFNNVAPTYWTSWDNNIILFDAYDIEMDDTLQASRSLAYGLMDQTFQMVDNFVPPFDRQLFSMLLNASKVMAFAELKQTGHSVASSRERRALIHSMKTKNNTPANIPATQLLPDYGRRRPSRQPTVNFGKTGKQF